MEDIHGISHIQTCSKFLALYWGVEGFCWHWDFICKEEGSIHFISIVIHDFHVTCLNEYFLNFNGHTAFSEKIILYMYISLLLYLSIWRWGCLYSSHLVEWEGCYLSGSPGTLSFAVALWLDRAQCGWGKWDLRRPVVLCRVPKKSLCSVPALTIRVWVWMWGSLPLHASPHSSTQRNPLMSVVANNITIDCRTLLSSWIHILFSLGIYIQIQKNNYL